MTKTRKSTKVKNVLVCPLDWGLGHASRDVEIISNYIKQGCNVIIAADKSPLLFLREHFPNLQYVVMRGISIRYSRILPFKLKMLMSLPKILYGIFREHQRLKKIIQQYNIDIVVSDNRYGLWNQKVRCIFITHQLWVKVSKVKIIEQWANRINHWFINKYDECWVPDYEGCASIAGELSNPRHKPQNVKYIGILSRFKEGVEYEKRPINSNLQSQNFAILAIISGVEPQRSIFENIITQKALHSPYKTMILRGKPATKSSATYCNINYANHLDSNNLQELIKQAELIICRSGYSGIMDLLVLNKKALIIPTPGQTEQEYLAKYLSEKKLFYSSSQNNFSFPPKIAPKYPPKNKCM